MPDLTRRRSPDHRQECWSTMATSTPIRSSSASATRTILTDGNGAAASIRDRIRASIKAAPPPVSPRPAPTSSARGEYSYQNAPRLIFRCGRDQRDWTAEKYRRFDRGERMPHMAGQRRMPGLPDRASVRARPRHVVGGDDGASAVQAALPGAVESECDAVALG